MQYRHRAYGLQIESELELWPGADSSDQGEAQITVRISAAKVSRVRDDIAFALGERDSALYWPGVGLLRAQDGVHLDITPESSADSDDVRLVAAGTGLAMLLQQRGCTVLHGSCVYRDGVAQCIVGPSGRGKSTLAGALCQRGHGLVSDGMTVVGFDERGIPKVFPGPRVMKLLPDSAGELGWVTSQLHPIAANHEKLACPVLPSPADEYELGRVVVLGCDDETRSGELSGSAATMELVRNFYLVDHIGKGSLASVLSESARLATAVPVYLLRSRTSLSELRAIVAEVVSELPSLVVGTPRIE